MKYRVLALMGVLALTAGTVLQAQDYDDIYYDASQSASGKTKVEKQSKTVATYGEVPEKYKVVAQDNYRVERDVDEYNRRGAFEPTYEVDINGDTLYLEDESFANTRRIERFYNPDVVILSDDDDLVELYYDESPSINLIVGSDYGYAASYGWASSYYPWYTGWYEPWYTGYYRPWYGGWYDPWSYSYYGWYSPWYHSHWYGPSLWGWNYWGPRPWHYAWGGHHGWNDWNKPHHNWAGNDHGRNFNKDGWHGNNNGRVGLASNRGANGRVQQGTSSKPGRGISSPNGGNRAGGSTGRVRGGYATTRGGGTVGTSAGSRGSGTVSRSPAGNRSSSSSSVSGGTRSVSGSRSSSSGSYSGGSRSSSSGGSRSSSGGSYSSGSRGSSGGGSHGSSSGGGSRRR